MKLSLTKWALAAATLLAAPALYAQQAPMEHHRPAKRIEVTGSAEREITPDILYYTITLQEYKDGSKKVDIETLEKQLVAAVAAVGIVKENFRVESTGGNQLAWRRKKDPEFMATKSYRLKLADLNKINDLLAKLDDRGVLMARLTSFDYSQVAQLRTELRLAALKAAREKAKAMVESIGETLGGALEISEMGESGLEPMPQPMYRMANSAMLGQGGMADGGEGEIDFRTIKFRVDVRGVFEIK